MKKALITGITGQDGSYPAEFLLAKDAQSHVRVSFDQPQYTADVCHRDRRVTFGAGVPGTRRRIRRRGLDPTRGKPSVSFVTLVEMMTKHDLDLAQQEVVLNKAGHRNVARGVTHG
jgi:hypothetical protein